MGTISRILKACVSPDKKRDRRVSGTIIIIVPDLQKMSKEQDDDFISTFNRLHQALLQVASENPWRDPEPEKFICGASGRMQDYQKHDRDKDDGFVFHFRPSKVLLNQGKIYAYQKYLETLATKLAVKLDMRIFAFLEVQMCFDYGGASEIGL